MDVLFDYYDLFGHFEEEYSEYTSYHRQHRPDEQFYHDQLHLHEYRLCNPYVFGYSLASKNWGKLEDCITAPLLIVSS